MPLNNLETLVASTGAEWLELYTDHSKANKAGITAMRDDTTRMSDAEIYTEFGIYMTEYDAVTQKGPATTTKAYRIAINAGRAEKVLESIAKSRRMDVSTLMNTIRREGLSQWVNILHESSRGEDVNDLITARINANVDKTNMPQLTSIITDLRARDPKYAGRSDHDMHSHFDDYLKAYLHEYHIR